MQGGFFEISNLVWEGRRGEGGREGGRREGGRKEGGRREGGSVCKDVYMYMYVNKARQAIHQVIFDALGGIRTHDRKALFQLS